MYKCFGVALTTPLVARQNGLPLCDLGKLILCSITLSLDRDPLEVVLVEKGVICTKNKLANCTKGDDEVAK
ncbi:19110_t:CDS:2, partial [Cetraspora pellucida]